MRLHPNPPRLVTVIVALALAVVGVVYAWPIESLVPLLAPLADIVASTGFVLDQQTGFVCLFASPAVLVVGSLLPGI